VTHSWTHTPVLKLIPKSDVLVKKVVVRRNIRARKRNGRSKLLHRNVMGRTLLGFGPEADQGPSGTFGLALLGQESVNLPLCTWVTYPAATD
jgi:hypothetical protein